MSRRRHGRPHHQSGEAASAPPPTEPADVTPAEPRRAPPAGPVPPEPAGEPRPGASRDPFSAHRPPGRQPAPGVAPDDSTGGPAPVDREARHRTAERDARPDRHDEVVNGTARSDSPDASGRRCTPAQLRRFIKSRPYIPMHELRRRFGIDGAEDDVTLVQLPDTLVFVGLPEHEGRILGDLLRGGDVGYELSVDPWTPIIVGVYPMRPVPRA